MLKAERLDCTVLQCKCSVVCNFECQDSVGLTRQTLFWGIQVHVTYDFMNGGPTR